jgi:hypothetical protein
MSVLGQQLVEASEARPLPLVSITPKERATLPAAAAVETSRDIFAPKLTCTRRRPQVDGME